MTQLQKLLSFISILLTNIYNISAQKLTLQDLTTILKQNNWNQTNVFVKNKGFNYNSSTEETEDTFGSIVWTYNFDSSTNDANSWFRVKTEKNKIVYVGYRTGHNSFLLISNALVTSGYKLVDSKITNQGLFSTYQNSQNVLGIKEVSMGEHSYYDIELYKKEGPFDKDNGVKEKYQDGKKIVYTLKNGKLNGITKIYDEDVLLETITYVNDEKNGPFIEFYNNGKTKSKGFYKDGLLSGEISTYYEEGVIENKGYYTNGNANGLFSHYNYDGTILSKITYKDDVKEGTATFFSENGKKTATQTFRNDILNGPFTEFYENGKIKCHGEYLNENPFGEIVSYNDKGIKKQTIFYNEQGKPITCYKYHDNGNYEKYYSPSQYIEYDTLGFIIRDTKYEFHNIVSYKEYSSPNKLLVSIRTDESNDTWENTWYDENGNKKLIVSTVKNTGLMPIIPFESFGYICDIPINMLYNSSYPASGIFVTYDTIGRPVFDTKITEISNEEYKCYVSGEQHIYNSDGTKSTIKYDNDIIDLTSVMKECRIDNITIIKQDKKENKKVHVEPINKNLEIKENPENNTLSFLPSSMNQQTERVWFVYPTTYNKQTNTMVWKKANYVNNSKSKTTLEKIEFEENKTKVYIKITPGADEIFSEIINGIYKEYVSIGAKTYIKTKNGDLFKIESQGIQDAPNRTQIKKKNSNKSIDCTIVFPAMNSGDILQIVSESIHMDFQGFSIEDK